MTIRENTDKTPEESVLLKNLKVGDVFRYAHDSFEEALQHSLFFMVVEPWQKGNNKVCTVACDGRECTMRDEDHRVVKHYAEFLITRKS